MTAAFSVLGVDLEVDDEPTDGSKIQAVAPQAWVKANAEGLTGCLLQLSHADARQHEIHLIVSDQVLSNLQAGYDGQTPDAPTQFICPRPGFEAGVDVIATEFEAFWTEAVRGSVWWEVRILLVEFAPTSFSAPAPESS